MWEWTAAMMEYYQANGAKFKDDGQSREEIYNYWLKYGQ